MALSVPARQPGPPFVSNLIVSRCLVDWAPNLSNSSIVSKGSLVQVCVVIFSPTFQKVTVEVCFWTLQFRRNVNAPEVGSLNKFFCSCLLWFQKYYHCFEEWGKIAQIKLVVLTSIVYVGFKSNISFEERGMIEEIIMLIDKTCLNWLQE